MYTPVLLARARYYMWQFKDNPQASAFALDDYKKGLKQMRSNLLNPVPKYMTVI
jgi:predicted PolB exonuclease-like 3'-5' exonuclease